MNANDRNQESREPSGATAKSVGGWWAPIVVAAFTILWCLLIYRLIGDRPVDWKYGVTPYVPGQSIISTQPLSREPAPRQVELPSSIRSRTDAQPARE